MDFAVSKHINKAPKIALCRECRGSGKRGAELCQLCQGSGRVWVAYEACIYLSPYRKGQK